MQFRQVKSTHSQTVLAIRSVYSTEKKRCDQVVVGRFNLYDAAISSAQQDKMTSDEIVQANAWLSAKRDQRALDALPSVCPMIITDIDLVIEAINDGRADLVLKYRSGSDLYAATDRLRKSLRKAGFLPRSVKVEEHDPSMDEIPLFDMPNGLHSSELGMSVDLMQSDQVQEQPTGLRQRTVIQRLGADRGDVGGQ